MIPDSSGRPRTTLNNSGQLRTTSTSDNSGRRYTTPIPDDSRQLRTTLDDSGQFWTTPYDFNFGHLRLRATSDDSGQLRTTPFPGGTSGSHFAGVEIVLTIVGVGSESWVRSEGNFDGNRCNISSSAIPLQKKGLCKNPSNRGIAWQSLICFPLLTTQILISLFYSSFGM